MTKKIFIVFVLHLSLACPGFSASLNWQEVEKSAKNTTVTFTMWGGSTSINAWVDGYVSEEVKKRFGITLKRRPISDAAELVNQLLGEKQAGRKSGSTDLAWVNGENFKILKKSTALTGPFLFELPNFGSYYDADSSAINMDFGNPVEGFEAPYGRAQFIFIYESQKIKTPPKTLDDLLSMCRKYPGRFTYPAPPDFIGSAFVRHIVYEKTGGYPQYLGKIDLALLRRNFPKVVTFLKELKSCSWHKGETYPNSSARLNQLYADGEVWFSMAYSPASAENEIIKGVFPASTRTFVLSSGTLSNTHFLAIPFNAPNVSGAKVVANFLLSPDAQLSKYKPENWGDFPALSQTKLSAADKKRFADVSFGPATLSLAELFQHQVPEIDPEYLVEIEKAWTREVARK